MSELILFDGRVLSRDTITGVERYAAEIFEGVSTRKNTLLAHPKCGGTARDHIWVQAMLPLLATRLNATTVFCPVMDAPIFLANKIRLVVTIHDLAFLRNPEMYNSGFRLYYKSVMPFILRRANSIICLSNFEKEYISERFKVAPEKIHVVYHGVSDKFRQVQPKKKLILAVSARNKHKNIARLVSAFASIADKIPHKLVLVGPKRSIISDSENFDDILDVLRKKNKIIETGYVSDAELVEWYGKAEIFAFPSLFEGFGFPPLEAMASGCAVTCSQASVLPEICGGGAVYFDPTSIEDIASKLLLLATNEQIRNEMVKKGTSHASAFTWDRCIAQTLTALER
ncbi:glycosyltransferase family 1 protein [Robbsia sp. KACC 23696]|uniref:glycosyltransferase family 4 protein n=1 Tax=Robbsia sp. KACC 23696 TaxID=3149231 RepID=UPI00325C187F